MYSLCNAFDMSDNNDGQGKYECPEDHEVFENSFEFGRHVRNNHRGTKVKPIINGIEEAPRVEVTRNPQNDFDNLERIMLNAGMSKGVAANVRIIFENYDPQDIDTLEALLRENGINKAVRNLVVATYAAKLGIEIQEPERKMPAEDNGDNYTEKLVKQRLRRHELFIQAKTSGMSEEDIELLFPEFVKEKKDARESQEVKKKRIFPPESGNIMELTDTEYSDLLVQWEHVKAHRQQPVSDIETYKEITQNIRDAGLFNGQRGVKDEMQLELMQSSLRTIENRLSKTEPVTTLLTNVINKLNDSGKLPTILNRFMSRFDNPKPDGMPIRQWTEDDYSKLNEKLNQKENIYQQQINSEKKEENPGTSTIKQAKIDHVTGKPMTNESPYAKEQGIMQKEYGLTSDEVGQVLFNVKSATELKKIMDTLRRAKDGIKAS